MPMGKLTPDDMLANLSQNRSSALQRYKKKKKNVGDNGSNFGNFKTLERDQLEKEQYHNPLADNEGIKIIKKASTGTKGKNLIKTAANAVKRVGGSAVLGALKGANQIGALGTDIVMAPYDLVRGAIDKGYAENPYTQGAFPRFRNHDELWEDTLGGAGKDVLGLKGTLPEQIASGIGEMIPSIPLGGAMTKATGLLPDVEKVAASASEKLGGKILGKGAQRAIRTAPDMLSTYALTEAAKPSKPKGSYYGAGNIDLNHRPVINNPDGSISTVDSVSFNIDGKEVLVPKVRAGLNRLMTDQEALDWYQKTGQYLGKFDTVAEADKYAEKLHEDQDKLYNTTYRTPLPEYAADWIGGDLALKGLGKAGEAVINKLGKGATREVKNMLSSPIEEATPIKATETAVETKEKPPVQTAAAMMEGPSEESTTIKLGRGATPDTSSQETASSGSGIGKTKQSQFQTNTLTNSPFLQDKDIQKVIQDTDMMYEIKPNVQTVQRASQMIQSDMQGTMNRIKSSESLQSAEDAAAAAIITNNLRKTAQETGDYTQLTDWLKVVQPKVTSTAQSLQAISTWKDMTPEGALMKASQVVGQANREIEKVNPNLVKEVDNLSQQVSDSMNNINQQGINEVVQTPEVRKMLNKANEGLMAENTNLLEPSDLLAQKVESYVNRPSTDKTTDEMSLEEKQQQAVKQMVNTLFQVARETLPQKGKKAPRNPLDVIYAALKDKEQYQDVWEKSQQIIREKFKDTPQFASLQDFLMHYLERPYQEKTLQQAINNVLKENNINLDDVAAQQGGIEKLKEFLVNKLMNESEINRQSARFMGQDISNTVNKMAGTAKEKMSKSLAKRVVNVLDNSTPQNKPAREMVNTLFKLAKQKLPHVQAAQSRSAIEKIEDLINNKKAYGDIWRQMKNEDLDNDTAKLLDDFFNSSDNVSVPDSLANQAINKTARDLNIDWGEVIRDYYSNQEKTKTSIVQVLMDNGMRQNESQQLSKLIQSKLDKLVTDKKETALAKIFHDKGKNATNKSLVQKIIEMSNLGAFDSSKYKGLVEQKLGLPTLTAEDARFITETMQKVEQMPEGTYAEKRAKDTEFDRVKNYISNKIPAPMAEKIKGLQRIMMLLNPKTIVTRNALGNAILGGFETAKDIPGSIVDAGIGKITGQRTTLMPSLQTVKTLGKGAVRGFKEVTEDIKNGVDTSPTRGQYELPMHQVFKNPILNKLDTATSKALEYGDRPFWQGAYDETLRQQMKINGVAEPTDEMKEFALRVANDRTFQNDSQIANAVANLRTGVNKLGASVKLGNEKFGVGNVVLPFAKTPSNIMDKAIDYSPVGAIRAISELRKLKKGTFDQKRFVDTVGRSIVGTGLIMLGYDLAKAGVITGQQDKDKDVANFMKSIGQNPYSFNMSAAERLMDGGDPIPQNGDIIRTYDFAQPVSVALAVGADIYSGIKNRNKATSVVRQSVESGGNTLLKQSLLQGLTKMMGGYDVMSNILDTVMQVPLQFLPTIGSQIAKGIDSKGRETYSPDAVQKVVNQGKGKVPVVRNSLPIRYDTLGRETKSVQGGNSFWNNFLNPGITQEYNPTPAEQMVLDIYNKTGEKIQFPRYADKTVKGKQLTSKQYVNYQQYIGRRTYSEFSQMANNSDFRSQPAEDQAKQLQSILTDINAEAKEKILGIQNGRKGKKKEVAPYMPW